jgi:hypothetical protein
MNKIPTAEAFANKAFDAIANNYSSLKDLAEDFREFTKLHVEAALKAANSAVLQAWRDKEPWPDEESILSAYPLTNIQ